MYLYVDDIKVDITHHAKGWPFKLEFSSTTKQSVILKRAAFKT